MANAKAFFLFNTFIAQYADGHAHHLVVHHRRPPRLGSGQYMRSTNYRVNLRYLKGGSFTHRPSANIMWIRGQCVTG